MGRCVTLVVVKVAVLSDTHAPRFWKGCPRGVAAVLEHVELILHAGDVCTAAVLEELSTWAPVHAVLGNNDGPDVAAWGAPETLSLDLDGLPVAMLHDSGPAKGRPARLRRRFPDAAGRLRPFPQTVRRVPRRAADLQPWLAHRQAPAAARHDGTAGNFRRHVGIR